MIRGLVRGVMILAMVFCVAWAVDSMIREGSAWPVLGAVLLYLIAVLLHRPETAPRV